LLEIFAFPGGICKKWRGMLVGEFNLEITLRGAALEYEILGSALHIIITAKRKGFRKSDQERGKGGKEIGLYIPHLTRLNGTMIIMIENWHLLTLKAKKHISNPNSYKLPCHLFMDGPLRTLIPFKNVIHEYLMYLRVNIDKFYFSMHQFIIKQQNHIAWKTSV